MDWKKGMICRQKREVSQCACGEVGFYAAFNNMPAGNHGMTCT
jgi:hypothetical protein